MRRGDKITIRPGPWSAGRLNIPEQEEYRGRVVAVESWVSTQFSPIKQDWVQVPVAVITIRLDFGFELSITRKYLEKILIRQT